MFNNTSALILQDEYSVYDMNGLDLVAAKSQEEATKWFLTEINDYTKKLNPIPLDLNTTLYYMDNSGSPIRIVSLNQLINEAISDGLEFPCILVTFDY